MASSVVLAVNIQRGLSDYLHRWACFVYRVANEYLVESGEGVQHRLRNRGQTGWQSRAARTRAAEGYPRLQN